MAKHPTSPRPKEAPAPAAEAAARIASRRKTADRRLRILERLTNRHTVAHIARAEQLTAPRVRQIIVEMLASRDIDPPAGFVQFQIARRSEAMIVARTMIMEGNPQARDRLIALCELDRYHGFAPAQIPAALEAAAPRLARPERCSIPPNPALGEVEGKFSASQALEIPRNAKGIPESAPRPRLAAPERRPIPPNPARGEVEGKFSAPQAFEIPQNCERIPGAAAAGPRRARGPLDPRRIGPVERTGAFWSPASRRETLTTKRSRREMAPQRLEKIESGPGNGTGSEASNLQDVVHGCAQLAEPIAHLTHADNPMVCEQLRNRAEPEKRVFLGSDMGEFRLDHLEISRRIEVQRQVGQAFGNIREHRAIRRLGAGLPAPGGFDARSKIGSPAACAFATTPSYFSFEAEPA